MADQRQKQRVVSLIRISTKKQKKDKDADYQRSQVKLTCSMKNLEHIREFSLEDISGLIVRQTDGFKELKKAIAKKDIDGLVLPTMSRLGRTTEFKNVAALMAPFEEIMGSSKKLIWSRTDVFDVTNPEDRDKIWNAFRFAEQERSNLKFITSAQKDVLRLEPDTLVDKLPKGIDKKHIPRTVKPKRYVFTYEPEYRTKIAAAYRAVLNDEPLIDIAADLGYDSINGARETLKNEWWIGYKTRLRTTNERKWDEGKQRYFIGGKKRHANPIRTPVPNLVADPAVSREVWEAVQAKLAVHRDHFNQRRSLSKELLATGYLHCGCCGLPMYHKGQQSRTQHAGYFWCKSKAMSYHKDAQKKTTDCGIGLIPVRVIEDDIVLQIQLHLADRITVNKLLEDASNVEAMEERKRALARIEHQIEDANNEKKRMLKAIQKGVVSEEEFEDGLLKVRSSINNLSMKAASIRQDIESSISAESRERMAAQMASDFAGYNSMPFDRQAMLLGKYVKKIIAHKNPVGDVTLHFDVRTGAPEMMHQPDSFPSPMPPQKAGKLGKKIPIRVVQGGAIGGVPSLPEVRSKLGRQPRPSS